MTNYDKWAKLEKAIDAEDKAKADALCAASEKRRNESAIGMKKMWKKHYGDDPMPQDFGSGPRGRSSVMVSDNEWRKRVSKAWDARTEYKSYEEKTIKPMKERIARLEALKKKKGDVANGKKEKGTQKDTSAKLVKKGFLNLGRPGADAVGQIKNAMSGYGDHRSVLERARELEQKTKAAEREKLDRRRRDHTQLPDGVTILSSSGGSGHIVSEEQRREQLYVAAEVLVLSALMASVVSSIGLGFYLKRLVFVCVALSVLLAWRATGSKASISSFPLDSVAAWKPSLDSMLAAMRRFLGVTESSSTDVVGRTWSSKGAYARACLFYWLCIGWHASGVVFGVAGGNATAVRTVVAALLAGSVLYLRPALVGVFGKSLKACM